MRNYIIGLFLLLLYTGVSHQHALQAADIVVVVLSQADVYNSGLATQLKDNLKHQASILGEKAPIVHLTHEELEFQHPGAWTVIPILPKLYNMDGHNSSWVLFCEERTRFDLQQLVSTLSQHDHTEEVWLGHGLHDKEPTIIHHFAFADRPNQFQYPLLAAGFAVSSALLKRLSYGAASITKSDFSIDAMHELAIFVQTALTSLPSTFCLENQTACATYPLPFLPCGEPVPIRRIFFAVKTCLKHHTDRVPVVMQTWGLDVERRRGHIEFFSDVIDKKIPTTGVGIANTARGHCAKTMAILNMIHNRHFPKGFDEFDWLVLADDDTLLSVPRLQTLLSCWKDDPVVVGERYGYNVHSSMGYSYPTGGAGIAIKMSLLPTIVANCHCQADDSPDDMNLGFCLARFHILLVHSPFFHQARPADYAQDYLATQVPVSFHKHWMLDPLTTYNQWFKTSEPMHVHTDL